MGGGWTGNGSCFVVLTTLENLIIFSLPHVAPAKGQNLIWVPGRQLH